MKVVDMHCDTIAEIYNRNQVGESISILENDLHMDLTRMKRGDYRLQTFALFVHLKREKHPFEYAMKLVDTFYTQMEAHKELIGIVKSWKDIQEHHQLGKMSALLSLEEGGVCQGELSYLRDFYRLGVRMMTLTWNFKNELAYPNRLELLEMQEGSSSRFLPENIHGLTETGLVFLDEMERLGMIIDISHLGDAGIWQVFKHTKNPLVASHSNARGVTGHCRNLTDEMIRTLAERGGVAGINYCASFLQEKKNGLEPTHSYVADMVTHMNHMKQVGGIECIGLGSDFDGISSHLEMKDCGGMDLLAQEMKRQGFTGREVELVFSGNVLRVYEELLRD